MTLLSGSKLRSVNKVKRQLATHKTLKRTSSSRIVLRPSARFGIDDQFHGNVQLRAAAAEMRHALTEAITHIKQIEGWFNKHAAKVDLPIRMRAQKIIDRLKSGDFNSFNSFFNRVEGDNDGIIHETQIITIINIFVQCLLSPRKCGLVLGALQGGKTLTAIAIQWLGPVLFLLTGDKVKPIYLITNQTSHQDQTERELERFLSWYGDIEIVGGVGIKKCSLTEYKRVMQFIENPTLNNYRNVVVPDMRDDLAQAEGFLHRRVHGRAIKKIGLLCSAAHQNNIEPILILDEAQMGASDPEPKEGDHTGRSPKCVLRQILDSVKLIRTDMRYIAVSATPFELFDLTKEDVPHVWLVRQALSSNYRGFNCFGGKVIDNIAIETPMVSGFTAFGKEWDISLMANDCFDFRMYAMKHKVVSDETIKRAFIRWKKKHFYRKSYEQYQVDFLAAVKAMIYKLSDREEPVGICVRACNDNQVTRRFIAQLKLDPTKIEVLEFFNHVDEDGKLVSSGSVKRILRNRKHPDLPYLIFVTNKARMGDAFPSDVQYFADFSHQASDMNALLQGLLGRACGYNKTSTVVLSDYNANIVANWAQETGGHVYRTSRHSVTPDLERKRPVGQLHITRDLRDPVVRAFWKRVDGEIVAPMLKQNVAKMANVSRVRGGTRTAPLLKIAGDLKLFEHLESSAVRKALFPTLHPTPQAPLILAREKSEVKDFTPQGEAVVLRYRMDAAKKGWCAFTFRHSESSRGGIAGRGKHDKDPRRDAIADRACGTLNPEITMEKYHAKTGVAFDDRIDEHGNKRSALDLKPGRWRAHTVSFPLVHLVQELVVGTVTFPNERSPLQVHMRPEDFEIRDPYLAQVKAKKDAARKKRASQQ